MARFYGPQCILTDEKLIQERWKSYFEELLNVENLRDPLEHVEAVEGPEDEISRTEIEKVFKQMRNNKAPGPSGITAEMTKALDELGVDWLHTILNEFLTDECHGRVLFPLASHLTPI